MVSLLSNKKLDSFVNCSNKNNVMKIISWNINGIRACEKKGFLDFLKKEDPDILCVQETKAHLDQLSAHLRNPPSYHVYWSLSEVSGYSGTAVFSKNKARAVSYGIGLYKFDREGRFVILDYGDFILFNIYFPNGSKDDIRHQFKQEFLRRLSFYVQKLIQKKKQLVVVGDYNVAYLDIDVYDPIALSSASGFLPEERKWFSSFLSMGFVDVYRHFYPDKKKSYTWWSYKENARKYNRGWRIDHICVTQGLKNRLQSVSILDKETGSDHCPITTVLKKT